LKADDYEKHNVEDIIKEGFDGYTNVEDKCSISKIKINNNISNIKQVDMGDDDDYDYDM